MFYVSLVSTIYLISLSNGSQYVRMGDETDKWTNKN